MKNTRSDAIARSSESESFARDIALPPEVPCDSETTNDATHLANMAVSQPVSDRLIALCPAIVTNSAHAIITTTRSGVITALNPAAEKLLGQSACELVDQVALEQFYLRSELSQRAALYSQELGREIAAGFEVLIAKSLCDLRNEDEWTYVIGDGKLIKLISAAAAIHDASGEICGFVFSLVDITVQQQDKEKLLKDKERIELAIGGASDGLWDWDIETGEVYYSKRFKQLLDFQDDEFEHRLESLLERLHSDDRAANDRALRAHFDEGKPYEICVRLRSRLGQWRWFRLRGEAIANADGKHIRMAGSISDTTNQKNFEEKLALAAVTDQLTGLANRTILLEQLRAALSRRGTSDEEFCVMFLDFDRFKSVNDSWGPDVGDRLLQQVADRLRLEVQLLAHANPAMTGTIARLGGDEFVVLLEHLSPRFDLTGTVEQLQYILSQPYELGAHVAYSTASIGVVIGPCEYTRAEDVLRDADTAMYEAKRAGRDRFTVFDEEMHRKIKRHVTIENGLRDAILQNELALHYQPIVSLVNGQISAVEALLRWNHPELGPISPAEFIPVAQDSDLILRIGEWVLREGCRQCANWRRELKSMAPPCISINLARRQFLDPMLPILVLDILEETGLPPNCLQLEVTEESFAGNVETAVNTMLSIKKLGVRLAIDDFGSESSSFVALHQFPLDVLKVDRALIRNIEHSNGEAALLHGLVVMARNLNIALVAEGIETSAQAKAIADLGCEFMQGYFFARPMSEEALHEFLTTTPTLQWYATGANSFADGWQDRMSYMVPAVTKA